MEAVRWTGFLGSSLGKLFGEKKKKSQHDHSQISAHTHTHTYQQAENCTNLLTFPRWRLARLRGKYAREPVSTDISIPSSHSRQSILQADEKEGSRTVPRRFVLPVTPVQAENPDQQPILIIRESQWADTYIVTLVSLVVEVVRVSGSKFGGSYYCALGECGLS